MQKRKEENSARSDELKSARQSMLQYESGKGRRCRNDLRCSRCILKSFCLIVPKIDAHLGRSFCRKKSDVYLRPGCAAEKGLEHSTLRNEMEFLKDGTNTSHETDFVLSINATNLDWAADMRGPQQCFPWLTLPILSVGVFSSFPPQKTIK